MSCGHTQRQVFVHVHQHSKLLFEFTFINEYLIRGANCVITSPSIQLSVPLLVNIGTQSKGAYNKIGAHGPSEHMQQPLASGVHCVVCVLQ